MKIGKYELCKPWIKYVDMPIEEELYWEIRKSIGEDIAKEIEAIKLPTQDKVIVKATLEICAAVARGQN